MRLSSAFPAILTFAAAAVLAVVAAFHSVTLVEERSEIGVRAALDSRDLTWAEVEANGLQVTVAGIAPNEALRFQALSAAGSVVDAARVIDELEVAALAAFAPPRFSAEILRNDAGISVIGLIPAAADRDALAKRFLQIAGDSNFADLMETADHPVPADWNDAITFALRALEELPRSKISVEPGQVHIIANTDSGEEKDKLENELRQAAPPGLTVRLDIAAPRPVLTPFTLRFVMDTDGIRFDTCSADSEDTRNRIVQAGFAAGLTGPGRCTIGMGVPTPRWAEAAEIAIAAVADLGGGSVTFSDADIVLHAPEGTEPGVFDRIVGELENNLPDVFALTAKRPRIDSDGEEPREFIATLSPEGLVQLRGRIGSEQNRELVASYAQSLFGSGAIYSAARIDDTLPPSWTKRVLTGLEALGTLHNGVVEVTGDSVSLRGMTHREDAQDRVAQLLADKLGDAGTFDLQLRYEPLPEPEDLVPAPEVCFAEIAEILEAGQITFEPGSARVTAESIETVDKIADVLEGCGDLELEIQGHTDSQGREEMNLALSQDRAEAVLAELLSRRVLTSGFTPKGYGETQPIADNGTEDGREANRRIEFKPLGTLEAAVEGDSALDNADEAATEDEGGQTTEAAGEQN